MDGLPGLLSALLSPGASAPIPSKGLRKFSLMSPARDLRGDTYITYSSSLSSPLSASPPNWSMNTRKAERVFPVPVGALTSTCFPSAMAGHASLCILVGSPNVFLNQLSVAGRNCLRVSSCISSSMRAVVCHSCCPDYVP